MNRIEKPAGEQHINISFLKYFNGDYIDKGNFHNSVSILNQASVFFKVEAACLHLDHFSRCLEEMYKFHEFLTNFRRLQKHLQLKLSSLACISVK
jgi:hypothetical protein